MAGLSQRRLSEIIMATSDVKLYPSAVTRIETGQREPKLTEAVAIARALGMSLSELVDNPVDYATRFDQALNNLPVRMHEASESLKHLAAQLLLVATLLDEHPDLLSSIRFAGDRQPRDAKEYLTMVADGFRESKSRRESKDRSSGIDPEMRELVSDVLAALASTTVPDDAET